MTGKKADFALGDFLAMMLEAIDRIDTYLADRDRAGFLAEGPQAQLIRDAVVHNIGLIGELANDIMRMFPTYAERTTSIPFSRIYGMRNRLLHGYHAVDYDVVWATCQRSLPELRVAIDAELQALKRSAEGR